MRMKAYRVEAARWWPSLFVYTALGTERSKKMAREMGYGELPDRGLASTCHIEGDNAALVCIYDGFMEEPKAQRSALLAHEAVHCAQAWCGFIGEDSPGDEEFAYMVQCCMLAIEDGLKAEKKLLKG